MLSVVVTVLKIFRLTFSTVGGKMSKRAASDVFQDYNEKHSADFMQMLNEDRKNQKMFCDEVVQCNGRNNPIHKCVVGIFSEFFKKQFFTEVLEKTENVAKANDLTRKVLENVLDFVYTGNAKITNDNVRDLLMGAEVTQIPSLTTKCEDFLMNAVCAENSLKFRAYAQRFNLEELQTKSLQLIKDNLVTILQQENFNELDAEEVSTIFDLQKDQASEETAFTAVVRWVNHNLEQRKSLFAQLFNRIELKLISSTFLNHAVKTEPLVLQSLDCLQGLFAPGKFDLVESPPELSLLMIGGAKSETISRIQSFRPDKLEGLPNLNVGRIGAAAVKYGSYVYVVGGGDKAVGNEAFKSVEVIHLLERENWKRMADMMEERQFAAATLLNRSIYVSGGWGKKHYLNSCEKYDCDFDKWTKAGRMLQARGLHAMVELKGSLYCVGGTKGGNPIYASAEWYDSTIETWKKIAPMNKARWGLAAVAFNGHIYATGGASTTSVSSVTTSVERYDPESNSWIELRPLNIARYRHGACVFRGKIYVFGGIATDGKKLKSVEVYDEASNTWENRFDMESCPQACTVIAV